MNLLDSLPCYRIRQGDNLYIPGRYTREAAIRIAQQRASQELPPEQGGARYYVIRESVEGEFTCSND